jgi:hypothetical protein
MSFYTIKRLLTAAVREGLVWYFATAGERLARKHIRLPKRRPTRRTRKTK